MTTFKRGDRVLYSPYPNCPPSELQPGIVKSVTVDGAYVFVLYHTKTMTYSAVDLDRYTAARTNVADISK